MPTLESLWNVEQQCYGCKFFSLQKNMKKRGKFAIVLNELKPNNVVIMPLSSQPFALSQFLAFRYFFFFSRIDEIFWCEERALYELPCYYIVVVVFLCIFHYSERK
jgi:hypothetical protein